MIQVELRPETEARLIAEAQARGIGVAQYAGAVLERAMFTLAPAEHAPGTPEEIAGWLNSLAQFSEKIPPMPDEVFSRAWIYQDHD